MVNSQLHEQGFAIHQEHNPLRDRLLQTVPSDFSDFCQSWDDLPADPYLLDGGQYRYRRYSVFRYDGENLQPLPPEPHYQSRFYNTIHGGIDRYLESWQKSTISNPVFPSIVDWAMQQIDDDRAKPWRIQAHQFRVVASGENVGKPAPEGIHKDGADYVLIMLIQRKNIIGGISEIYDNQQRLIEKGVLDTSGDFILLNDSAVYHGVTDINIMEGCTDGLRDVLVLTFHRSKVVNIENKEA